jgi:hypothetical protein
MADGYVRIRGMSMAEVSATFDAAGITYEPYGLTLRVTHIPEGTRITPKAPVEAPAYVPRERVYKRPTAAPVTPREDSKEWSAADVGAKASDLAAEVRERLKG